LLLAKAVLPVLADGDVRLGPGECHRLAHLHPLRAREKRGIPD
jgi:hypothetical protein